MTSLLTRHVPGPSVFPPIALDDCQYQDFLTCWNSTSIRFLLPC